MRYIQYLLLSVSILICGFLFYLSAKQIDLVPFKNNQKENQIMIVEKTNDINYLKSFTEDLIENESNLMTQISEFSARINTWIILLFITQFLLVVLFFIQYKNRQRKEVK